MDVHPWIIWTALALLALALVLASLRLLGVIAWPWWLVFAPLYPIAVALCLMIVALLAMALDGVNGNWH